MEYEKYIAPVVVALALSTGCKYGCNKDTSNSDVRPASAHRHSGRTRHRTLDDSAGPKPLRGSSNHTYRGSVKPEHVLEPKYGEGNQTGALGEHYLRVPEGTRVVTVVPYGPVIVANPRRVEGGNYSPKGGSDSAGACFDSGRALEDRARDCARRLPPADEVFGSE